MASDYEITKRVIMARERAGLQAQQVAKSLGLTKSGYSPYENDLGTSFQRSFSVQQLLILSRILGKTVNWFLGIPDEIAEDEEELLIYYRQLDDHHKRLARSQVRGLVDAIKDA